MNKNRSQRTMFQHVADKMIAEYGPANAAANLMKLLATTVDTEDDGLAAQASGAINYGIHQLSPSVQFWILKGLIARKIVDFGIDATKANIEAGFAMARNIGTFTEEQMAESASRILSGELVQGLNNDPIAVHSSDDDGGLEPQDLRLAVDNVLLQIRSADIEVRVWMCLAAHMLNTGADLDSLKSTLDSVDQAVIAKAKSKADDMNGKYNVRPE